MDLNLFKQDNLFNASFQFFRDIIGLKLQTKSKTPIDLQSQFDAHGIKSKKVDEIWSHVDKTYYIGLLDDENFEKIKSNKENSDLEEDLIEIGEAEDEYPGILIFAVDLGKEFNPTRSNLAEINRTLNRFSVRVPVLVLARYGNKISLMIADRVAYKQEWREGEKIRKVSLLRDINLNKPHAGHLRILKDLVVPTSGTKKVENFDELYEYWKGVLDTSELNKKFYQDLSNWYFWAIKHVRFPDEPTAEDAHEQDKELDDMLQEHRATNVIRLLTRLLFVWFIKEKGLIPEELFDIKTLQKDILNKITPHHERGMFKEANKESIYYKAILQNLFFATLNCPIEASSADNRERGFRRPKGNYGVTFLMRYEDYFKDKEAFLELVNSKVPFLNGGLFECLDMRGEKEDKEDRVWVDGFSDNLPGEHKLIVPDFLFFGVEEHVDLSEDYGLKSRRYKEAAVKGLLNIFNSYKFTITENTPIEEDVALDPELLGKVFENLLASYNPETKTTARKQTGSFYTPREIVNYMVDESLIAYLKNAIDNWGISGEELDKKLHQLISYEESVPFKENEVLQSEIITALSNCTILDPACGSGAFPMGILQKMVHILQKLDPGNEVWKEVQKEKASQEADQAISEIEDKDERRQRLIEINEAFDERINAPDYARKLFLIENCIYGVDIQPVATQISKLRFFISLVVEQKVGAEKINNFGIRPLPNLETKFVTANTLIDIKDNSNQTSLYETDKIKKLEAKLKQVRSKLFSARTTDTKYKYRQKDERLRNEIAQELKKTGWPNKAADKLASWDPYNQNTSSPFFNSEWMFDVTGGFNIVIGNPPYISAMDMKKRFGDTEYANLKSGFKTAKGTIDIYILFFEFGLRNLKNCGLLNYISPNRYLSASYGEALREFIYDSFNIESISDFSSVRVFEAASTYPIVSLIGKKTNDSDNIRIRKFDASFKVVKEWVNKDSDLKLLPKKNWGFLLNSKIDLVKKIISVSEPLGSCGKINATSTAKEADNYHDLINEEKGLKLVNTGTIDRYLPLWELSSLTDKGETFLTPHLLEDKSIISGNRLKLYKSSKIILAKIGLRAEAFYDKGGEFASINTNCIHSFSKGFKPEYITAWVNSKPYHFLFSCLFDGLRMAGGYLLYSAPNLKSTFIKKAEEKYQRLIYIIYYLMQEKIYTDDSIDEIDDIIDAIFCELLFTNHMSNKNIDVIRLLEKDLESVLKENDFENLNKADRKKGFEQLYYRWSDPKNEIRQRINSFPEKSPDILKPIMEV